MKESIVEIFSQDTTLQIIVAVICAFGEVYVIHQSYRMEVMQWLVGGHQGLVLSCHRLVNIVTNNVKPFPLLKCE